MGDVIEIRNPLKNIQMLCDVLKERYNAERVTIKIVLQDKQTLDWKSK